MSMAFYEGLTSFKLKNACEDTFSNNITSKHTTYFGSEKKKDNSIHNTSVSKSKICTQGCILFYLMPIYWMGGGIKRNYIKFFNTLNDSIMVTVIS